jgi:tetratricopeptide (TPR) repeat protein
METETPSLAGEVSKKQTPMLLSLQIAYGKRITMNILQKAIEAEHRASKWLADGNEYAEKGDHDKAEKCYEKSQYWLDQYNKLVGNS